MRVEPTGRRFRPARVNGASASRNFSWSTKNCWSLLSTSSTLLLSLLRLDARSAQPLDDRRTGVNSHRRVCRSTAGSAAWTLPVSWRAYAPDARRAEAGWGTAEPAVPCRRHERASRSIVIQESTVVDALENVRILVQPDGGDIEMVRSPHTGAVNLRLLLEGPVRRVRDARSILEDIAATCCAAPCPRSPACLDRPREHPGYVTPPTDAIRPRVGDQSSNTGRCRRRGRASQRTHRGLAKRGGRGCERCRGRVVDLDDGARSRRVIAEHAAEVVDGRCDPGAGTPQHGVHGVGAIHASTSDARSARRRHLNTRPRALQQPAHCGRCRPSPAPLASRCGTLRTPDRPPGCPPSPHLRPTFTPPSSALGAAGPTPPAVGPAP